MVWFVPSTPAPVTKAYLTADLPSHELENMKKLFERGTHADLNPMLEMKILKAPADWAGQSHAYMRRKETEAGNDGPFVVIDEALTERGGVWYVSHFANDDDVEDEQAASTDVLWEILVTPLHLAIMWVNYDIANMSIAEDLGNCGVDFPAAVGFRQPEIDNAGGLDMEEERRSQPAWITAAPGEYEVSTKKEDTSTFLPSPGKVVRLKEDVAKANGLVSSWSIVSEPTEQEAPDGTPMEFPEGSVGLQVTYDLDFERPKYQWPEGSL